MASEPEGTAKDLRAVRLDELAAHPERAANLSPEERSRVVLTCSAIIAAASTVVAGGNAEVGTPSLKHDDSSLLTCEQAAERVNVPVSWIRQIVKDGRLSSVKLGHYRRIKVDDLERFVEKSRDCKKRH